MNVFISSAGEDRAWAEWIAWQLEAHSPPGRRLRKSGGALHFARFDLPADRRSTLMIGVRRVRSSEDEPNVQQRIDLLIAFYSSARAELINRIGHRDNALLLFMAAVTAVFGLAFGEDARPTLLLTVAPLGLGASLILAQHNDVIGALGQYCGMEVAEQASNLLAGDVPDSWDTSAALLQAGPRKLRSAGQGEGISRFFTDRLYASLLLIVAPGIAGTVIGVASLHSWWIRLATAMGDGAAIGWTIFLLWNSYTERNRRRRELIGWRTSRAS